jgi:hypothetical protein
MNDALVQIGYQNLHIKSTSYIFSPEGVFRINEAGTRWIAPIEYLRR